VVRAIALNNLTVEQAVKMLKGEGGQFAAFVPKGIIDIVGLVGAQKLLIRATDEKPIDSLEQLLKAIDQPKTTAVMNSLTQAYVIELKNITPDQAVRMLQDDGSRYKAFVPKEITEIIAIPNTPKLLVQTADAAAALRLTQLISLIDQPNRLALQVMLIKLAPPQPGGERQPMPTADGNTPLTVQAVRTWVQSLVDNGRGSAILFPDLPFSLETNRLQDINVQPATLQMPPFITDIDRIMFFGIAAPDGMAVAGGQTMKVTISVVPRADNKPGRGFIVNDVTLVVGQTTLVPVEEHSLFRFGMGGEVVGKRIFLAVTPVYILPSPPELGLAPTTDGGYAIRGTLMLPGTGLPAGTTVPGMPGGVIPAQ